MLESNDIVRRAFGWSASDIVAALQLLHKVVVALKDTVGVSSNYQNVSSFLNVLSVTLQHLKALQTAPLDPDLAQNLGQLYSKLRHHCHRFVNILARILSGILGQRARG